MRSQDTELFIAAFLALFVVLSPVVQFFDFAAKAPPKPVKKEILPAEEKNMVGQLTPNLEMIYLNGEKADIEDLRGRTLVLYLWSTWAPSVPKEMWFLNQLNRQNSAQRLAIIALNIGSRDRLEKIEYYVNRRNIDLPVVTSTSDVLSQFNVKDVPAVFIIDKNGIIRYEALGQIDGTEFSKALAGVLSNRTEN